MGLKIVVCGAGEVGTHIATMLAAADHHVTLIETEGSRIASMGESLDISTITGSCTNGEILLEAEVPQADLVVACTNQDEVNLLTASLCKSLGAKRAVARVEHRVFFESGGLNYASALNIDGMICPDYSTAQAIARVLRNPRTSSIEDYGQDEIEIHEFTVTAGHRGLDTPLKDLRLPKGTLLAAISRDGHSFVPNGESVVQSGDSVVLIGNEDVFQTAREWFDSTRERLRQIVIMAGSPIAVWLCRELKHRRCSIRLFEPDRTRAEELGNKLDWVTVVQEDIVDPAVFEEEKVDQADVFIACGEDDEQNILSCIWAKNKGTRRVMTVSGRSDYLGLLNQVGIDNAFSPRNEAAEEIENFLLTSPLRQLGSLFDGTIGVYRVPVGSDSETVGKTIQQVGHPNDWIIGLMRQDDRCFVPVAEDVIKLGDTLVIVGGLDLASSLGKLFGSSSD